MSIEKVCLSHEDVCAQLKELHYQIEAYRKNIVFRWQHTSGCTLKVWGVPRGGVPVAYGLLQHGDYTLAEGPDGADIIVDDLIDSGTTRDRYTEVFPTTPFYALFTKQRKEDWYVFPWERDDGEEVPTDAVTRLLQYIGEDVKRPGLEETPRRFVSAFSELTEGLTANPSEHVKLFPNDQFAGVHQQPVLIRDIPFVSLCEHHLLPFNGVAYVAYHPNQKILGLSKFSRILDVWARRPQVQERLGDQYASFLANALGAVVAVKLKAGHTCMSLRGAKALGAETVTLHVASPAESITSPSHIDKCIKVLEQNT